jgi:hypothetical protein
MPPLAFQQGQERIELRWSQRLQPSRRLATLLLCEGREQLDGGRLATGQSLTRRPEITNGPNL